MNRDKKNICRVFICFYLVSSVVILSGCSSGPRNYLNDNDRLRAENDALIELNRQQALRLTSLEQELAIDRIDHPSSLPAGVIPPRCVRIEISAFSGGFDADGDGKNDSLRIYLVTLDPRDRFVQTLGNLHMTAAYTGKDAAIIPVAVAAFDLKKFDGTYRAGLTGVYYTLIVPLASPVPDDVNQLTVAVELTDAITGKSHTTEKIVNFRR